MEQQQIQGVCVRLGHGIPFLNSAWIYYVRAGRITTLKLIVVNAIFWFLLTMV